MTEQDYHSQKGAKVPRLTYSIAKLLIGKSPLHAAYYHPLLGGHSLMPSKSMDVGTVIHDMFLGGGPEIVVIPFDNFRKKEAQQMRDKAIADGKTAILEREYQKLLAVKDIVEKQLKEQVPELFDEGEYEKSAVWKAFNGIECQSRFDFISVKNSTIIDLKTTTDANPDKCVRKMLDFGYDIQEAMYTAAANFIYPELAGRFDYKIVFIESSEPYAVSCIETTGLFKELGMMKYTRAADLWKRCLEENRFPGYGRTFADPPTWAYNQEMENAAIDE